MLDDLGLLLSRAHVLGCHVGEEPHGLEEVQRTSSPLLPLVRKEGRHETTTAHRVCVRTRPSTSAGGVKESVFVTLCVTMTWVTQSINLLSN